LEGLLDDLHEESRRRKWREKERKGTLVQGDGDLRLTGEDGPIADSTRGGTSTGSLSAGLHRGAELLLAPLLGLARTAHSNPQVSNRRCVCFLSKSVVFGVKSNNRPGISITTPRGQRWARRLPLPRWCDVDLTYWLYSSERLTTSWKCHLVG
jgi:hypothetical protein